VTTQAETWIGLAIQIPLVGIFVYFTLIIIDKFLKSIDTRDAAWREFFNTQREANNQSIASMAERFATEIRSLGKEIAELRGNVKDINNTSR